MNFKKSLIACVIASSFCVSAQAAWFWEGTGADNNAKTAESTAATAAVDEALKKEQQDCADGKEGTVGASIKNAVKIHTEVASAQPKVEELFDIDNSCFGGLMDMMDLSVTIPSWSQIGAALEAAAVQYAKRKICTAVQKQVGLVTDAINKALGKVGGMEGITDLNGLTNGAISGALSQVDPQLGSDYVSNTPSGTTYSINQSTFTSASTTQTSTTQNTGTSNPAVVGNNTSETNNGLSPSAKTSQPTQQGQTQQPQGVIESVERFFGF